MHSDISPHGKIWIHAKVSINDYACNLIHMLCPGNHKKLFGPWRDGEGRLNEKTITIILNEESVKLRRCRVRGVATLQLVEHLLIGTAEPYAVPERHRFHYYGSNKGNVIAYVNLQERYFVFLPSYFRNNNVFPKQSSCGGVLT